MTPCDAQQMLQRMGIVGMAQDGYGAFVLATLDRAAVGEKAVPTNETPTRPGAIADEIDAVRCSGQAELGKLHAHRADMQLDGILALDGALAGQAEHHQIIHVSAVLAHLERALDEVVERIEVDQRVELAQ